MLRRIKYRLLKWLLDDICDRTGPLVYVCENCEMGCNNSAYLCAKTGVFKQARKVWKLEE